MTDLILCGCGGKMGAAVRELASAREDCRIVAGVDLACQNSGLHFPVYRALSEVNEAADCIIDFSHPSTPVSYTHLDVYKRQTQQSRYFHAGTLRGDGMGDGVVAAEINRKNKHTQVNVDFFPSKRHFYKQL